jgi:transposase-like protein
MLLEQQDQYDSQWAAMNAIAAKVGCTAKTLRKWVRQAEHDLGLRNGVTSVNNGMGSSSPDQFGVFEPKGAHSAVIG